MINRVSAVITALLNSQILCAIKCHKNELAFCNDCDLFLSTMPQVLPALPMEVVYGC